MKHLILLTILITSVVSCSGQQRRLKTQSEEVIKQSLWDGGSYKFVSFDCTNCFTNIMYVEAFNRKAKKENYREINWFEIAAEVLKDACDTTFTVYEVYELRFYAKNRLGLEGLRRAYFLFSPQNEYPEPLAFLPCDNKDFCYLWGNHYDSSLDRAIDFGDWEILCPDKFLCALSRLCRLLTRLVYEQ